MIAPTAAPPILRARDGGIDAGRTVLAFLIVVLHGLFFHDASQPGTTPVQLFIASACRAAVPFFLIASGYWLKLPDRTGPAIVTRPLLRLAPAHLFWLMAYAALLLIVPLRTWTPRPGDLLTGGAAFHLWFLPALAFALIIVAAGHALVGRRWIGVLCATLALAGLARNYHGLLGLPPRAGLGPWCFAPLLVHLGTLLKATTWRPRLPSAAAAVVVSYVILIGEELVIGHVVGRPVVSHDLLLSTILLGLSTFLFARALPDGAALRPLAHLGRVSLGIYASHLAFIWTFQTWLGGATLASGFAVVTLAFAAAALLCLTLRRIPALRRVVS